MRGEIHNRERAKQILDFSGLRFGTITPTNIDGFCDFWNTLHVWCEYKVTGTELPEGQRLALARTCDATQASGIMAVVLIAEHDTRPEEDVDCASCPVREYRYKGEWKEPVRPITCREAIEKLLDKAGIPL